jgi:hypothetical protein
MTSRGREIRVQQAIGNGGLDWRKSTLDLERESERPEEEDE